METKVQKLKRWLCRLLGCEDLVRQMNPVVLKNGDLETFHYDGYDMEIHLLPAQRALRMKAYLKGSCVLVGDCRLDEAMEWQQGTHHPSYKTRKYMQDYAAKRLTQLKDGT